MAAPRHTGRLSGKRPPTRTSAEGFSLAGPSSPPDPTYNAYRKDLADVALAGEVIASHYAEPAQRTVATAILLRSAPVETADVIAELSAGEQFLLLDDSLGWAWGYAGKDRRVGYVPAEALSA